jgi:transcriptional regulator GlxA family with amidase domain
MKADKSDKTKILFVISPRTHFLDFAGPDQVFHEAIFYKAPLEVEYSSYAGHATTSSGLTFEKLKDIEQTNYKSGDYIFIPGVDVSTVLNGTNSAQQRLFKWLKKAHEEGVNICSVCTGAFLIAETGLLNERRCTTHWKYTSVLQKKYPNAVVEENVLYTEDCGIFCSAGIVSGIDLALYIVEKMYGEYFAYKVARELVVYTRRSGHEAQQSVFMKYRNHIHTGIHKVQDWLQEHIDKRNSLIDLAEMANMSDRNFTRIFKKETGLTVNEYITRLRKEKINELVKNPDLSRKQIAQQIGLKSERQLSRLLQGN